MFKPNKPLLCLSLCLIFLLAYPSVFAQETITFSTYYPSPYGSYNQLQTNSFGVGDVNNDGNLDASDVPTNPGEVWIKGKVGIGTTSPWAKTEISLADSGTTYLGTMGQYGLVITNTDPTVGNYAQLVFRDGSNQPAAWVGTNFTDRTNHYGNLIFSTYGAAGLKSMTLTSAGNVGIGTTGPTAKLHVLDTSSGVETYPLRIGNEGTAVNTAVAMVFMGKDAAGTAAAYGKISAKMTSATAGQQTTNLTLSTVNAGSWNDALTILGSGNVGIGTTGPQTKLDISLAGNASEATLRTTVANNAINLVGPYVHNNSYPGIMWSTSDNSPTLTKAGIWARHTNNGSFLNFGTSNSYGTGITNTAMTIDYTGNVGIGTTNPSVPLHIQSNSGGNTLLLQGRNNAGADEVTIQFNNYAQNARHGYIQGISGRLDLYSGDTNTMTLKNGLVGIGTTNPNCLLTVNGSLGSLMGCTVSDLRYKKNIQQLSDDTLNRVLKLRGVSFDWRRGEFKQIHFPEGRQIGIIAQELEKEFPELVTTDKEGYKAVSYDRLTAVLLEAIKAQQKEIEGLKQEIQGLKGKL